MNRRRRVKSAIALGAIGVAVVAAVAAMGSSRRSSARLAESSRHNGLEAHARGDDRAAVIALAHALGWRPDDLEALVAYAESRARLALREGAGPDEAARAALRAIDLARDERGGEFLARLAAVGERIGDVTIVLEVSKVALASDPDDVESLERVVRLREGEPEASEALDRLIALEPDEIEWRMCRLEEMRRGEVPLDTRVELCREWGRKSGRDARGPGGDARGHRGDAAGMAAEGVGAPWPVDGRYIALEAALLAEAGRISEAVPLLVEASGRSAQSSVVLRLELRLFDALRVDLAHGADALRALADAEARLVGRALADLGERSVAEELLRRAWLAGRLDEVLQHLEEAGRAAGAGDIDLACWRALVHAARGETGESTRALDVIEALATSEDPDDRERRRTWVGALRASQDERLAPVETVRACAEAVAIAPDDPALHALLGSAYSRARENDLAVASYERAIGLERAWLAPRRDLALLLDSMGRPAQALELLAELERRVAEPVESLSIEFARVSIAGNEGPENEVDRAILDLAREETWSEPAAARSAIERLERSIGAESPRVELARAREVIAFAPHDRARVAGAKQRVAAVLRRTPESLDALMVMSELSLLGENPDEGEALRLALEAADLHPAKESACERVVAVASRVGAVETANTYARRLAALLRRAARLEDGA